MVNDVNIDNGDAQDVFLSNEEVSAFCDYLDSHGDYLDTGLGAFHTDNHGNW